MTTAGGRVTLFGGIINYTARDGFTGIDTFTYTIQDSAGATAVGTVSISVSGTARLTAIQPNADRTIVLEFTGPPGKSCQVLASENTQTWTKIGDSICDTQGHGQYVDTGAGTNRFRLYRIEWP